MKPPPGSDGPRLGGPPGGEPPGKPGRGSGDDSSVAGQLIKWAEKLKQIDPLTGESILTDRQFEINVVVYKGNTPKKDIPKEYGDADKKAGDKGKDQEPQRPADPPAEERPDA